MKKTEVKTNRAFVARVQSQGGITFRDERYVKTGEGYHTCLHVYQLPNIISEHWLSKVCNLEDTIATVDISTEDINEVKKNLNKSIKEQSFRFDSASDQEEAIEARRKYQEMTALLEEISTMGEIVKTVHIRIFVYDRSLGALEEKIKKIMDSLEGESYRTAIMLNEQKEEYLSLWEGYKEQIKRPFAVCGQPLTSEAVAAGNPFHFSSMEDACGDYLGETPCGGNVIFDEFTKNDKRLYYNAVIVGEMGSGKSTLLKKRFLARAVRGDYVRAFDISGEFTDLTLALGGKVIRPDGTNGILNPLEILSSGENENVNFTRHISKVSTIYKFLVPTAGVEMVVEFQNNLRELYEAFDLVPNYHEPEKRITGLPAKSYPTFSDLLQFIHNKTESLMKGSYNSVEETVVARQLERLSDIESLLDNIVHTYGSILDGHTSLDNILDEQIVTFDISQLKEMESSIFDAQVFNMVSLCWDNCVKNGSVMKAQWEAGRVKWEDIVRYLILIDESHRWINTGKMQAVELITVYMREARKYFGGIFLASQSIRDYVPEGADSERLDKLKIIFELTQYKFIFRQNSNVISLIDKVFDGVLTESQKATIPRLTRGSTILCIASDQNLQFKVFLSDLEAQIFSGGA